MRSFDADKDRLAPLPASIEVDATLSNTLEVLDEARNYRRWILDLIRPSLAAPILEVGAGHGTFTAELAELGSVVAVEPSVRAAALLRKRFEDDSRITVSDGEVDQVDHDTPFRAAVLVNVLEHIPDDGRALDAIRARLVPGGSLALWVPAFQFLFSDFDRKLGHHRRYRRRQLEQLVRQHGFEVERSTYANLPGWFSWLLLVRLLRRQPAHGLLVSLFDRLLVPVTRAAESKLRPPFGQSILLIARKPADPG